MFGSKKKYLEERVKYLEGEVTNLEWLKEMKSLDKRKENYWDKDYRQAKALEIIAEEFCLFNNRAEEYGTELKGANQIKINLDNLECPKGFTKKVIKKIKKRGGEKI